MHKTIEEIIAESKQKESEELVKLEEAIGDFCDAYRCFIDVSGEWKTATDMSVNIKYDDARTDLFTARAVSLSVLTARILERAREMPKVLMSGALMSTVGVWRYISETKNIAMAIDLDLVGPTGFLWLNHGMIDQAKVEGAEEESPKFAEQAKQILAEAGLPYDKEKSDLWKKGVDGKKYVTAVDRSRYVWRMRKFPAEFGLEDRSSMAEAEQQMIRLSNSLVHPTMTPQDKIKGSLHPMMLTTILDSMAVMLAYKVAVGDVAGWPYTDTVGEQFHVYPPAAGEARDLSYMVRDMQDRCLSVFREKFMNEE